ncbi:hypothetical protein KKC59_02210 [bacterium]|nr:hypothetical protein [bacterium]
MKKILFQISGLVLIQIFILTNQIYPLALTSGLKPGVDPYLQEVLQIPTTSSEEVRNAKERFRGGEFGGKGGKENPWNYKGAFFDFNKDVFGRKFTLTPIKALNRGISRDDKPTLRDFILETIKSTDNVKSVVSDIFTSTLNEQQQRNLLEMLKVMISELAGAPDDLKKVNAVKEGLEQKLNSGSGAQRKYMALVASDPSNGILQGLLAYFVHDVSFLNEKKRSDYEYGMFVADKIFNSNLTDEQKEILLEMLDIMGTEQTRSLSALKKNPYQGIDMNSPYADAKMTEAGDFLSKKENELGIILMVKNGLEAKLKKEKLLDEQRINALNQGVATKEMFIDIILAHSDDYYSGFLSDKLCSYCQTVAAKQNMIRILDEIKGEEESNLSLCKEKHKNLMERYKKQSFYTYDHYKKEFNGYIEEETKLEKKISLIQASIEALERNMPTKPIPVPTSSSENDPSYVGSLPSSLGNYSSEEISGGIVYSGTDDTRSLSAGSGYYGSDPDSDSEDKEKIKGTTTALINAITTGKSENAVSLMKDLERLVDPFIKDNEIQKQLIELLEGTPSFDLNKIYDICVVLSRLGNASAIDSIISVMKLVTERGVYRFMPHLIVLSYRVFIYEGASNASFTKWKEVKEALEFAYKKSPQAKKFMNEKGFFTRRRIVQNQLREDVSFFYNKVIKEYPTFQLPEEPMKSRSSTALCVYNPQARSVEKNIPEVKIQTKDGQVAKVIINGVGYADVANIPAELTAEANLAGLVAKLAGVMTNAEYTFKLYKNAFTLEYTLDDKTIELKKDLLEQKHYGKSMVRMAEALIKAHYRTLGAEAVLPLINSMIKQINPNAEELVLPEQNDRYEALLRLLCYKTLQENFDKLGADINWDSYREEVEYLHKQNILLSSDPELEEYGNYLEQDAALCSELVTGGADGLIGAFLDDVVKATDIIQQTKTRREAIQKAA